MPILPRFFKQFRTRPSSSSPSDGSNSTNSLKMWRLLSTPSSWRRLLQRSSRSGRISGAKGKRSITDSSTPDASSNRFRRKRDQAPRLETLALTRASIDLEEKSLPSLPEPEAAYVPSRSGSGGGGAGHGEEGDGMTVWERSLYAVKREEAEELERKRAANSRFN